jgi:hypothetical protein
LNSETIFFTSFIFSTDKTYRLNFCK